MSKATLDERLALLDRAETLAMKQRALQQPDQVVEELMADCARQGLDIPRSCVEQAVQEMQHTDDEELPVAPPTGTDRLYQGVLLLGMVLVGLFALRVLVPLLGRLLAPIL